MGKNLLEEIQGRDLLADMEVENQSSPSYPVATPLSTSEKFGIAVDAVKENARKTGTALFLGALSGLAGVGKAVTGLIPGETAGKYNKQLNDFLLENEKQYQMMEPSAMHAVPNFIGNFAATGGVLGKAFKGLGALGSGITKASTALPGALAPVANYGGNIALSTAAASGYAGLASPGDDRFNEDVAFNPVTLGVGALTGALSPAISGFAGKASKMGQLESDIGYNVKPTSSQISPNAYNTLYNSTVGSLPVLGTKASYVKQTVKIGNATDNLIKKLSSKVAAAEPIDRLAIGASKAVKQMDNRMKLKEAAYWKPINEVGNKIVIPQSVKDELMIFMKDNERDLPRYLKDAMADVQKESSTFNTLKNFRTKLYDVVFGKQSIEQSFDLRQTGRELYSKIFNNLGDAIKNSGLKNAEQLYSDYHTANEFSRNYFNLLKAGGSSLYKAIRDNASAYKFLQKVINEKSYEKGYSMTSIFSPAEKQSLAAGALGDLFHKSQVNDFLNTTAFAKNLESAGLHSILDSPTLKAVKGLEQISKMNATSLKTVRGLSQGMEMGVMAGAAGGMYANPAIAGSVMTGLKALSVIATTSPLKRVLIALDKVGANNHQLASKLADDAYKLFNKAGIVLRQTMDGNLQVDKKEEEEPEIQTLGVRG